ncbi:hypothetical protein QE152_g22531 [Popillia japonica]|uniref:Integrase catalytic domain-containing protein n=1 Tax=Popillia japonica TaxID=7064 RepID=A0AAW1KLN1_POPJA
MFLQSFQRHGLCLTCVADNGRPFNGKEFTDFLNDLSISHTTFSPYFPQSNGMVERHIQTIKGLLNKSPMVRPKLVILQYNSTPKTNLPSPAAMLMGRKLRTSIPVARSLLQPSFETDKTIDILKENQRRQEDYCNPRRNNFSR